ncbi:MAG TPA: beta-ketoacyl synthase N-terminal-like domain-containing protein [Thermodesulfovibrionia bacterium]|nr:beta-ketoacyl synthase N-terminal-like domain-containing protein [Thermodesulfovibrionia bacterium]
MNNFIDLLRHRSAQHPDKTAYIFLKNGKAETARLTCRELDRQAQAIAAELQAKGGSGERAVLFYPSGLDFIAAFLGCLYAGVIAVPAYPPRPNRSMSRLLAIVKDCQAGFGMTTAEVFDIMRNRLDEDSHWLKMQWVITDSPDLTLSAHDWRQPEINGERLAFLQYTSGSTGSPKGVMVSHGNIMHNSEYICRSVELTPESVSVTWLPNFHDMGLIDGILQPAYTGFSGVIIPPVAFLQYPIRWLEAISNYRAVHSGGPNFAYDLCVEKTTSEQRQSLDLSCWLNAYSGAEPIRPETLKRFAEAFRSCGFRAQFHYPCYGLAEGTLKVTGGPLNDEPVYLSVSADALEKNRVVELPEDDPKSRRFVSSGKAWFNTKVIIVEPQSLTQCQPDRVGEIWIKSSSVTQGYWQRPHESEAVFHACLSDTGEGPFLRTGDLGFLKDDFLFITGRLKDIVIIRGRNFYPQDIEYIVQKSHAGLRQDACAAFSVDTMGEERLVIVQELERTAVRNLDAEAVTRAVRKAVAEEFELDVYAVVLVKPGSIYKTSSSKIQRKACREGFLAGTLEAVGQWQMQFTHEDSGKPPDMPGSSLDSLQQWLINRIAQRLYLASSSINVNEPFSLYGMNSVDVVSISGELGELLGRDLSPIMIYDYPTINAVCRYLAAGDQAVRQSALQPETVQDEPIAIVGMACRFPGGVDSLVAFWKLLENGVDAITEVPSQRWNADAYYDSTPAVPGKMNTRWGGFLDEVDRFDPMFFGITPKEAKSMDPQQRLLLEVAWEALENGGIQAGRIAGTQTGVFIGISSDDYGRMQLGSLAGATMYAGTGSALSVAANRLSYVFNLHGPSLAVDTACSSSLVAVHQACQSLRQGECIAALAGGVNVILSPELTVAFSQLQLMSSDGRCKTFDQSADGYVRSEGCGIVVLKRCSDALRDGNRIYAFIRGSAVNQDGRSNGLTAPNGLAQQAVISQALTRAKVSPSQITCIEAHGTGTFLGDPVEANALKTVLMQGRSMNQPCFIGSVKTNIGHLESAAGIAGLIKTTLALHHKKIPASLHLKQLNPHIDFNSTPLSIPTQTVDWPSADSSPKIAGVSSFGFGGTNAHVILQEAPEPKQPDITIERPLHLFTISAKSKNALQELAKRYHNYLEQNPDLNIADIAFTANTGRSHFEDRVALTAQSLEQLKELLQDVSEGVKSYG